MAADKIEQLKSSLNVVRRSDWIGTRLDLEHHDTHVNIKKRTFLKINVGGLVFEVAEDVLKRDPSSLLASLSITSLDTSLVLPEEGVFYFDRDWWLFRYILRFLRDGFLPDDRKLLGQLYKEAGFWHLLELRKAIENEKVK